MSPSAKLGFVQIKMGVTTAWGATTRLIHLLGRQKTLELLASGKVMSSVEAEKEGLVNYSLPGKLTPRQEVAQCEQWLVDNFCGFDSGLLRSVKSSVAMCEQSDSKDSSFSHERDMLESVWGGEAQRAALEANKKHTK